MARKMSLADLNFVSKDSPNSQKVGVLDAPGKMTVKYAEIPEPSKYELRIRIARVGICGSDLESFRGGRKAEFVTIPGRLGHEVAGIVDKIGSEITGIKVGDKVTCRYVWGAFAEYIVCEPFNVKVLPDSYPLDGISLIEVLPGILHTAELARIDGSTNVLITGQGVSGLMLTQVISLFSPKNLAVTDLHQNKLDLAKQYGATHCYKMKGVDAKSMETLEKDFPEGFDVVIPCLLEGDGMMDALDCVAMRGKIVMYGCIGTCNIPFDFFKLHKKRADILSTEPKSDIMMRNYFQQGLQLVLDGLVNTTQMITHRFPLEQLQEAFELRNDKNNKDVVHVLIEIR